MPKTVYLASDHRGFEQKNQILDFLRENGFDVVDLGPETYDPDDDYPVYAQKVAESVQAGNADGARGIVFCGSACGIAIQANRFRGIRAVSAYSDEQARLAREHNDANVLCLSADFNSVETNESIARTFLATDFSGEERHLRRIKMLDIRLSKKAEENPVGSQPEKG